MGGFGLPSSLGVIMLFAVLFFVSGLICAYAVIKGFSS
jgi:hypothetical protein